MKKKRIHSEAKLIAVSASMLFLGATLQGLNGKEVCPMAMQPETVEAASDIKEDLPSDVITASNLDPVNFTFPYNTMSADWGAGEAIYRFYELPDKCLETGGCFPEVVQVYTQCLCEQNGISYPMVVALIERESQYRYDALGDDGKSKGYMQIYQMWHEERMEKLNCTDLLNPYQNIKVGIDYLAELTEKYEDERLVLMYYNRGGRNSYGTGALDLWEKGIYETEYSRTILERMSEIEKELGATE